MKGLLESYASSIPASFKISKISPTSQKSLLTPPSIACKDTQRGPSTLVRSIPLDRPSTHAFAGIIISSMKKEEQLKQTEHRYF